MMKLGKLDLEKQDFYLQALEKYKKKDEHLFNDSDRFDQTFYELISGSQSTKMIEDNSLNFQSLVGLIGGEVKEDIKEALKTGNIIVYENHMTWGNISISLEAFHQALGISRENMYTFVGPAITTSKFHLPNVRQLSNIIKTWPSTIPAEYSNVGKIVMSNLNRYIRKEIKGTTGKLIFMAPSGTRDKLKNGKFLMKNPNDGVISLSKKMASKSISLIMDEREVFSNNELKQGNVYASISELKDIPASVKEICQDFKSLLLELPGEFVGEFY